MRRIKKILVYIYNKLYDIKLNIELHFKWKKDLKTQRKLGLPNIISIDNTLDLIKENKLSICRYGDGEFKIMDGDKIFFQEDSEDLAVRLKEVIKSDRDDILICIPTFLDRRHKKEKIDIPLTKEEKKRRKNATKYMDNIVADRRQLWYSYFNMQKEYGNSLVSRFYAGVYDDEKSERWINKWKNIWKGRNLLIVEGEKTRLGVGNDLFDGAAGIRRILAPAIGAYSTYDKIIEAVKKEYKEGDLILIALGPTATVLAYDLALEGMQALDIGHIDVEYEWFLRKDRTHKKIEGKFVSEAAGGSEVSESKLDDVYYNQIVTQIKGEG